MGKITESPQSKSLANDNDIWKNLNIYFYFLAIRKINFIYELKFSHILILVSNRFCKKKTIVPTNIKTCRVSELKKQNINASV